MENDYTYKLINEGFEINDRKRIEFTDEHEYVVNTSLDAKPIVGHIFSCALNDYVNVYSIFKRTDDDVPGGDSNPVVFALKNERGWKFVSDYNKKLFWERFKILLYRFLRDHKGEYDTTIVIPSSNHLNKNIVDEIKKISNEVGITHISNGGLKTMSIEDVEDNLILPESYFIKYWKSKGIDWRKKYKELKRIFDEHYDETNGMFKYHSIPAKSGLRQSIIHTLEVDKNFIPIYSRYINNKHILLIDDSITFGQSIHNAIYALSEAYIPKSVSVLTMFSSRNDNIIIDHFRDFDFDSPYNR